jgi:hypothetical protein
MIEQLIPEDNAQNNTDQHINIKTLTKQLTVTTDDREFTHDEIRQTIQGFSPQKAPGLDGITMKS